MCIDEKYECDPRNIIYIHIHIQYAYVNSTKIEYKLIYIQYIY